MLQEQQVGELGRFRRPQQGQAQQSKKHNRKTNAGFLAWAEGMGLLTTNLQAFVKDKNKKKMYDDAVFLHAKRVAGANKVTLIDTTSIKRNGVSDFHNGRIGFDLGMILKKITIQYAQTAVNNNPEENEIPKLFFDDKASSFAAQILNGNLVVLQNNRTVKKLPISYIANGSDAIRPIDSGFSLSEWAYINGEEAVQIELELPSVALDDTKSHYVRIGLHGEVIKPY